MIKNTTLKFIADTKRNKVRFFRKEETEPFRTKKITREQMLELTYHVAERVIFGCGICIPYTWGYGFTGVGAHA